MNKNVVQKYYKRVFDDYTVLVRIDPTDYSGTELIKHPDGRLEKTEMEYNEEVLEDLAEDDFEETGPMEFNLFLNGLVK